MAPSALVAAVRSDRASDEIRSLLGDGTSLAIVRYDDPSSLDAAFRGASAIIHLAGILVERPASMYEQANVASVRSAVEAAKRCAVEKFVLVSARGADEKSPNRYYRTKGRLANPQEVKNRKGTKRTTKMAGGWRTCCGMP